MASTTKAHQRYRTTGGTIVPGVTTILNLLAKPALIWWAWNLGMNGEDYRKVKDKAADIGTVTHYLVECNINGIEPELDDYPPNIVKVAEKAFKGFIDWKKTQDLKTLGCEVAVVSEEHLFGGMIDWVAKNRETGTVWLYDVKTSKAVYPEYWYQVAAYKMAWDELNPDRKIEHVAIIHLDKITGLCTVHPHGGLEKEFKIFLALREVYALQKGMDSKRRTDNKRKLPRGFVK